MAKVRLLHALLLVAIACLQAATAAPALLLAVGAVSSSSARVLVDRADAELLFRVFRASDSALQAEKLVKAQPEDIDRPYIVVLEDLEPSTSYRVEFINGEGEGKQSEVVRFRTAPERGVEAAKVLVVSCDRFVDDRDDEQWLWLAKEVEHSPAYFGVAHIGDQVYVDAGSERVPIAPLPFSQVNDVKAVRKRYDDLLDAFRGIYRTTFGRPVMQRVLRRGAHWMLPDDHEVMNNVNRERVDRAFRGWTDELLSDDERALLFELTLHHRAGMQVFYEFQYQLQRDVPWGSIDFFSQPLDEIIRDLPLHFSVDVGALKLFFLDVRYDRAFLPETGTSKLIGTTQHNELTGELQKWRRERDEAHEPVTAVVLANLPLYFHSSLSGAIAYMVEKESYPGLADHRATLENLLATLIPSNQSIVQLLVGGDVHMMAHSRVCTISHDSHCVDQLIASGMTRGSTAIEDAKLIPFYYLITKLTPLVDMLLDTTLSIFPQNLQDSVNEVLGRAPWRTSYDRVYLGRNYGYDFVDGFSVAWQIPNQQNLGLIVASVLAIAADGRFDWKQTVVAPHESVSQHLVQVITTDLVYLAFTKSQIASSRRASQTAFDMVSSVWFHGSILVIFLAVNIVANRRVTRWLCTSKRSSSHKAKLH